MNVLIEYTFAYVHLIHGFLEWIVTYYDPDFVTMKISEDLDTRIIFVFISKNTHLLNSYI